MASAGATANGKWELMRLPPDARAGETPELESGPHHDCSNSFLKIVSPSIAIYAANLRQLFLDNNQIRHFDGALVAALPKLTVLDLSYNQLASVPPEMGSWKSLRELFLYQNQLVSLPVSLGKLCRLQRFGLDGNPLRNPPPTILSQGTTPIIQWLRDRMPQPKPPPDRKWILHTDYEGIPEANAFSVYSYNVLAEAYATNTMFHYCPSWALAWNYRKDKLLREIAGHDADILCLQEVEFIHFEDTFNPALDKAGYYGLLSLKSRARTMSDDQKAFVDGCAIFFRRTMFSLHSEHLIEFNQLAAATRGAEQAAGTTDGLDGFARLTSKDNIALVCLLKYNPPLDEYDSSQYLMVVNTHIHWDPRFADVKLMQVQLLLEELARIRASTLASLPPNATITLVIAGDFNSLPNSDVAKLLETGSVPPNSRDFGTHRYGRYTQAGCKSEFSLKSAYSSVLGAEMEWSNYTGDFFGNLDYIWYESGVTASAVLEPVETEAATELTALPNPNFPSDHIPIMARFEFARSSAESRQSALSTDLSAYATNPGWSSHLAGFARNRYVPVSPNSGGRLLAEMHPGAGAFGRYSDQSPYQSPPEVRRVEPQAPPPVNNINFPPLGATTSSGSSKSPTGNESMASRPRSGSSNFGPGGQRPPQRPPNKSYSYASGYASDPMFLGSDSTTWSQK